MNRRICVCMAAILLLSGCGGPSGGPPVETAETGELSWGGEGQSYVLTLPPDSPELTVDGCICYEGGDVYALSQGKRAGGDPLRLTKNRELLFETDFTNAYALERAGDSFWVVADVDDVAEARLYSADGSPLVSVPLGALPSDTLTDGENLWLDMGGEVLCVLPDGGVESAQQLPDYDHLVISGNGEIYLCTKQSGGEVLPLSGGDGLEAKGIVGSGLGDMFLCEARPDGIYSLGRDGGVALLISYEECLIEMGKLFALEPMGEGRFFCERPLGNMMLRPADPSEIGVKEQVTIAVFDTYSDLNDYIARFNAQSSMYEIVAVNYCSAGQSLEQGQMRMNTELAAGDGPDMIAFTDSWRRANNWKAVTAPAYIARGYLEDLTPYIEGDYTLNRANIAVYDALSSIGGVYLFGNSFTINGLHGTEERFGDMDGWTIDEYLELEASLEDWQCMTYAMDEHIFMEFVGAQYIENAIDWESGTMDFDVEEFARILEAASRVEEDNTEEYETLESFTTAWERIGSGQLMMDLCSINNPDHCAFDERFSGKRGAYFGWPSVDGETGLVVELKNPVGVVSTGEHKDVCWEFIKYMALNSPIGRQLAMDLPIYKPLIDAWSQALLDNEITDTVETEEDLELFYDILERPRRLEIYDDTVMSIMFEEADAYFGGLRSALEAAELVRERVGLYVAEQS